jgi:hypothetical protein
MAFFSRKLKCTPSTLTLLAGGKLWKIVLPRVATTLPLGPRKSQAIMGCRTSYKDDVGHSKAGIAMPSLSNDRQIVDGRGVRRRKPMSS